MSMLANTNVFDYINVLDKAADAAWLRNDAISNNISNADTPGYKRHDVNFEVQLAKAAIRAGIELLLDTMGREREAVRSVLLAGAFGSYLSPESACGIGMLPPELLRSTTVPSVLVRRSSTFSRYRWAWRPSSGSCRPLGASLQTTASSAE